ncbi:Oidioi.mRNA.OKI2018_I69.chr2.g6426.t1.cds [Oikopleura dioica]|uniref:Oidioi.mRNA.OKI2018_I69.chr2.g6426.t1.cds n=1 Tax=Oikopleura dioica TaxID=34765 RepID=A0ABN7T6V4_OIKDI|nr:Oidioi.mRNA.OKI2018_I69.chr2.g6426.t1.cds [Oikopleura dioica]
MGGSRERSLSHDSDSRRRSRSYSRGRRSRSRSGRRSRSPDRRRRSRSDSRGSHRGSRRSRSASPSKYRKQRHFGDRNDPNKSRCLGVFNLGRRTTEDEFRRTFERYGKLESCKLVYDQKREESRGFGFVTFENIEDAIYAKKDATGMDISGHEIRIDYSITKRAHSPTPGCYMGSKGGRGDRRGYRRSRSRDRYSRRSRYSRSRSRERRRSPSPYRRRSPSPYYSSRRSRSRSR